MWGQLQFASFYLKVLHLKLKLRIEWSFFYAAFVSSATDWASLKNLLVRFPLPSFFGMIENNLCSM